MVSSLKASGSQHRSLSSEEAEVWSLIRPERGSLEKLKRLSMRNRTWFTALAWKQHRLMDIVIQTVDRVRSFQLLKVLAPIVEKLLKAIDGSLKRGALGLMDKGAYSMMKIVALKITSCAQKWGNNLARGWIDEGFIKYLMVMNLPKNNNFVTATY
jgi:hypothetical protein